MDSATLSRLSPLEDSTENELIPESVAGRRTESLVNKAMRMAAFSVERDDPKQKFRATDLYFEDEGNKLPGEAEYFRCADGYLRQTPVQKYRGAYGRSKRRIKRGILIGLGVVLIVLLGIALWRSGIFKFRLW